MFWILSVYSRNMEYFAVLLARSQGVTQRCRLLINANKITLDGAKIEKLPKESFQLKKINQYCKTTYVCTEYS